MLTCQTPQIKTSMGKDLFGSWKNQMKIRSTQNWSVKNNGLAWIVWRIKRVRLLFYLGRKNRISFSQMVMIWFVSHSQTLIYVTLHFSQFSLSLILIMIDLTISLNCRCDSSLSLWFCTHPFIVAFNCQPWCYYYHSKR